MQTGKLFKGRKIILVRRRTFNILCAGILVFVFMPMLARIYQKAAGTAVDMKGLMKIEVSSCEYPYFTHAVAEKEWSGHKKRYYYNEAVTGPAMPAADFYTFLFSYDSGHEKRLYYSFTVNEVYDMNRRPVEPSPDFKEFLLDLVALYRWEAQNRYGELLPWDEADRDFSMYATARIIDIYTGLSFRVQRREGINHADVQPLTAEDTAIMKEIYGGTWSWERKGIIVETGGRRIAASMNGMPHGAGRIEGNNFPGHFCIHFLGSTIHPSGMDLRHHREILKAAGKLPLDADTAAMEMEPDQ